MAQAAFNSWLTSRDGRKATPQQIQDKMREFMGGGGGGLPNVPPVGAVKRIGG